MPQRISLTDYNNNTIIVTKGDDDYNDYKNNGGKYKNMNFGVTTDIKVNIKVPIGLNLIINSTYGDIVINGEYNNMSVENIYGNLDVIQKNISNNSEINLTSTYGSVDYSIPSDTDMEFLLSTSYGEILTDLDIIQTQKGLSNNMCFGNGGRYILHKGGSQTSITATYSNIYLRATQ